MVASVVLDLTLDIGLWVVTRLGSGAAQIFRYVFSGSEDTQLAIEDTPDGTAGALDAAAVLRVRGALDDAAYIEVVRSLVTERPDSTVPRHRTVSTASCTEKQDSVSEPAPAVPVPSAPPSYDGLFGGKLNLKA